MTLRIINRYLIKEVAYTLLAVAPILLLIFLSSRFVQYLADAASGKLPADIVFVLLGLKSITVFPLALPLIFFISIVLALGRLYMDNEMTSLAACGIGTPQVLRIMTPLILSVAVMVAFLSLLLGPWAVGQSNEIRDRSQQGLELSTIVAGRFKESRRGEDIFYAEKLSADTRTMDNVFIQSRRGDKVNVLSSANASKYYDKKTGDQFLMLKNGSRYELSPNHTDFRITQYEKYFVRFQQTELLPMADRREEKPTSTLLKSTDIGDIAELQWRISMPISAMMLGLIGVLLARTTPRQGRYAKLFIAILIYIIYINMMGIARAWVGHGVVTPLFGMWWVHALMLVAVLMLFFRELNTGGLRFKPRRNNGQAPA
ncbi:MAG: LPS export ABC transporter permease LptF [Gammaproteobacteria bacterium]